VPRHAHAHREIQRERERKKEREMVQGDWDLDIVVMHGASDLGSSDHIHSKLRLRFTNLLKSCVNLATLE
jgi:hypothetical protein